MKTLITLAANQGANWSLIWSDLSVFVCLLLIGIALYFRQKYLKQREDYLVKGTAKLCAIEGEKIELEKRIEELQAKLPKRNPDGTFGIKTGKGHGKKRKQENERERGIRIIKESERDWTKATKEELLTEAKRRYPVGTKIIPLNIHFMAGSPKNTAVSGGYFFDGCGDLEGIWCDSGSKWRSTLYANGKWAKIIK